MNLILLSSEDIGADGTAVLRDARAAHIRDVLKAKAGDTIRVGLIDGPKGTGEIQSSADGRMVIRCELNSETPPRPRVDLLLALPRPKVMKRLWAQLAALGVGRIILTNAWKVERNYFDTHVLAPEFIRARLVEGLEQAQDTRLPEVTVHKRFKALIEDELDRLFPEGVRWVAQPGAGPLAGVASAARQSDRVLLAVGPEGGWIDYEIQLLEAHGFALMGMGPRTLRTDTACVALLALLHESLASG